MEDIYAYKGRFQSLEMSEKEKELKRSWTNYFKDGVVLHDVRPVILSSWKRSQKHGISQSVNQAPICSPKLLIQKQEESKDILALIRPFMDDLFDIVKGTDSIIAFTDRDGVVLDLCGDSGIAINAAYVNFTVGANMSEEWVGTNSIGLALTQGKAVQVVGGEHYSPIWHTSHCSSAPIKDPFSNEIIGVITLIGYVRSANPHSLGLLRQQRTPLLN